MKIRARKQKKERLAAIKRGHELLAAQQLQEASEFLEEAVHRFPDDPEIRVLYASILVSIRPDDAAGEAAKAVELGPDEPAVLVQATHVLLNRGEIEAARVHATRATELAQPDFVLMPGLENLNGLLAYFNGNYDLAEEKLRSALDMEPANRSFARELAIFLAERGRLPEAVTVLNETLKHVKDAKDRDDLEGMRARMAREVASS